jgi:hypothetical protein
MGPTASRQSILSFLMHTRADLINASPVIGS